LQEQVVITGAARRFVAAHLVPRAPTRACGAASMRFNQQEAPIKQVSFVIGAVA
jgi:hypothetical protein